MNILELNNDERVENVRFTKYMLIVDLMDGRIISVPLIWYPRLLNATVKQRKHWEVCGGGYGIHWPDLDEDLSTEGLLRGSPAPLKQRKISKTVKNKPLHRSRSRVGKSKRTHSR